MKNKTITLEFFNSECTPTQQQSFAKVGTTQDKYAMHVFQIKGFSGLLLFLLACIATFAVVILLPSAFMMVLWNAIVFETFNGPEIPFSQGFLLWMMCLILFKLIFNPEIQFGFASSNDPTDIDRKINDLKNKSDKKNP